MARREEAALQVHRRVSEGRSRLRARRPVGAGELAGKAGIALGGGAEDGPLGPRGKGGLDAGAIAEAATELDRDVDRGRDPGDDREVGGDPLPGPVEVDDVDDRRPAIDPAPGGVDGIGVVGGLAFVVASEQPNGSPVADVDRRIEPDRRAHAGAPDATAAKLRSIRNPAALDFSGWNCVPSTLPRPAIAAKRPP